MVNVPDKTSRQTTSISRGHGPESELRNCIVDQSVVFQNAVQVIERLEEAAKNRTLGSPDSVSQLQRALDQVVSAQQKVAAAHAKFTATGAAQTPELKSVLSQHEQLLKSLVSRIDQLQGLFETVRQELAPQLDAESRRRNMQAAYQKAMRSF